MINKRDGKAVAAGGTEIDPVQDYYWRSISKKDR